MNCEDCLAPFGPWYTIFCSLCLWYISVLKNCLDIWYRNSFFCGLPVGSLSKISLLGVQSQLTVVLVCYILNFSFLDLVFYSLHSPLHSFIFTGGRELRNQAGEKKRKGQRSWGKGLFCFSALTFFLRNTKPSEHHHCSWRPWYEYKMTNSSWMAVQGERKCREGGTPKPPIEWTVDTLWPSLLLPWCCGGRQSSLCSLIFVWKGVFTSCV
jgi:hypothetical protein